MTDAVLLRGPTHPVAQTDDGDPLSLLLESPLPTLSAFDRSLLRLVLSASRSRLCSVAGLQHVSSARDPFILVLNHSTMLEALIVPAVLLAAREGQALPFLADWNFRLIPGVGLLYQRARTINVTRKPARPRILDFLRPLYKQGPTAWQRAEQLLQAGSSIALFPEGKVNRNPGTLLAGRVGAAYLSQRTGVPVVPAGLSFPGVPKGTPVPEGSALALTIGAPLDIPRSASLKARHAQIMTAISHYSGKSWPPQREKHDEIPEIDQRKADRNTG